MAHWYETAVDRQLREATERGEFDNLSGAGKPLPDHGQEYDDDWWVKDWLRREGATAGVLPPTLALRREVEDLETILDRLRTEGEVRQRVLEVNERIDKARLGRMDGPPTLLPALDPEPIVEGWRRRRGGEADSANRKGTRPGG